MQKKCAPSTTDSMAAPLLDRWGRRIDYLRIAVTDRCNLRCTYCMPPEGIRFLPRRELLTFEEILRVAALFARLGVAKIRLTGGEPFIRRDLIGLVQRLQALPSIRHLHFTTNGVLAGPHLEQLRELEVAGLNLSLDSLRRKRFHQITGRDVLPRVMTTLRRALDLAIPVKINTVVLPANLDELTDLAELAKEHPLDVRFIEPMPFNGGRLLGASPREETIRRLLEQNLPPMTRILDSRGTASLYAVRGFRGRIGIIAGHSRQFCGQCNKVRLTPAGSLKTCLYGPPVLDLKALLRAGHSDEQVTAAIRACVGGRARDGVEAAAGSGGCAESMASIGG
jgi:molybdenum cofactor biosynthesis protein A